MKEDFLHYLWRNSLYANHHLKTTGGQDLEILSHGDYNYDAGPDFFNAKIKIGKTIWVGNVEVHVNASDWNKHNHSANKAYENVILHVVAESDTEIKRLNGEVIPTLEIMAEKETYEQYLFLMNSNGWVPCESFINRIDPFTFFQWKEALLIERIEEKTNVIEERFTRNNCNWEETFYQTLACNFGFKVNSQAFELLAKSLPLNYLGKHKDQLSFIEAMLFGQSGLLPGNINDNYVHQLIKDYQHLSVKFKLKPIEKHLWKFMRLRPGNFPTIRIAQFAHLIHASSSLMSKIVEVKLPDELIKYFNIKASTYWDTHYNFGKPSGKKIKKFGKSAIQNIIINTVVPFLFFYGNYNKNNEIKERALNFLQAINAENNSIIKSWGNLGVEVKNAFDSQALIQLKNIYCRPRKCLNCRIGNQVIQHKF